MTITTYNPAYDSAHFTILDRLPHARRKHPEEMTFLERWDTIRSEMDEVRAELEKGDHDRAMDEYRDVGATLYRAMEELSRFTGVSIR